MTMRKLMVAAVFAGLAVGCAKRVAAQGTSPHDAAAYFPLAVGNRWTYATQFLGQQVEEKVEIVQKDGGYYVDNQGNRITVDAYGVRDEKRYLLREPVEVGRAWSNVVSVQSAEHYRVLQVGQECASPAGKFVGCVRVEGRNRVKEGTTLVNELTFAPKVGLVSMVVVLEENGKRVPQTRRELTRFELK
ncbi:MAG: hypothetical protein ACOZIN_02775 [Myxococcota bacterium]